MNTHAYKTGCASWTHEHMRRPHVPSLTQEHSWSKIKAPRGQAAIDGLRNWENTYRKHTVPKSGVCNRP